MSSKKNDFQSQAYTGAAHYRQSNRSVFFGRPANPYIQAKYCLATGLVCAMVALPLFFVAPLPAALVFASLALFFLATGLVLAANVYSKNNKDAKLEFNPGVCGF